MNAIHFAAAGLAFFAAVHASAADTVQRRNYVPCPRGYEGRCGDIPGVISSAVGAGEMICKNDVASADKRFNDRKRQVADWARRLAQIKTNLSQIGNAIAGLGSQYAAEGKQPPLAELADFVRSDLSGRLVDPLAAQLASTSQCYSQGRKASDGCYHLSCGDPGTIVKNILNVQPSIDRVEEDLENKRSALLSNLPASITAGTPPNTYNRCAASSPAHPCQQHMNRSVNQLVQAVQATSTLAGEVTGD